MENYIYEISYHLLPILPFSQFEMPQLSHWMDNKLNLNR
jgi:hypothetical protein